MYPTEPEGIAFTIEEAVKTLRTSNSGVVWKTWKDLKTTGQIIFCEVCQSIRWAEVIVADVTTLNLNLLFEIGFALGLGLPVIPVRDTTYSRDKALFERLGMLDTLGYLDFQNARDLAKGLRARIPADPIPMPAASINRTAPLYVLKGPIKTEGAVRMMSVLKKSSIRFRSFDPEETPRLSLYEARKQVAASLGIAADLLDQNRDGALVHNARAALLAGIGLASGKVVALLQEGTQAQPIDYRDVVKPYRNPGQIEAQLEPFIRALVLSFQDGEIRPGREPEGRLENADIGDIAAENEIQGLKSYFIKTAQFHEAKRGYARLVVGRKGSGKTAVFYGIREQFFKSWSHLVLDLKPEGHQFIRLREVVLSRLSPGLQDHTLVAFWNYILLAEMAQKIRDYEFSIAQRDEVRKKRFAALMEVYDQQVPSEAGDFSERLLRQVERLSVRLGSGEILPETAGALTEMLFGGEIRDLDDALANYLAEKEEVWILVDNLDKGWPTGGASSEDILILRTLLEASRRLLRQFERRGIQFRCLVFLRNDIYEHLVRETSDRGKDTAVLLDWSDPEAFKELVRQRLISGSGVRGDFSQVWREFFDPQVGVEDSFNFILQRTLMRPRDLLNFLHRSMETAINRGHKLVQEDDIRAALETYSEDLLFSLSFEVRDVFPEVPDPLYGFLGCPTVLSEDDVHLCLMDAGVDPEKLEAALSLLVWFGFLGVQDPRQDDPRFSYEVRYNVEKLLASVRLHAGQFVVHPAFRPALECEPEE